MSVFHLNPTISQQCPTCQKEIAMPVVPGQQMVSCEQCKTKLSVQLPEEPCRKILNLCREMEAKIGALISFRLRD